MAGKPDISMKQLPPWDQYKDKKPDDVAAAIYERVGSASKMMCDWYWASIATKRNTSLVIRGLAFIFLLLGTSLPIFAALQGEDGRKLLFTQWAVALLAGAGLLLVADRVFGWSSGWMRYITTVTTMENLTQAFCLEWGKFLVAKTPPLDENDSKALYAMGMTLEHELRKLQADETTKWVAEFNSGISVLETLIKTQREETDKKLEVIRTSLNTQAKAAESEEKSKLPGSLEVTLTHKAEVKKVQISVDAGQPQDFTGSVWSQTQVQPGPHVVKVKTTSDPPVSVEKVVEVAASTVARVEIKVP